VTLHILIAPSGFKESLGAEEVADCIAKGILRALPDARIQKAPLANGGEGFAKALVAATGGTLHSVTVTGSVAQPVDAHYGFLGGTDARTAVLEMASAAGLRLVPHDARNPLKTTTYGVGELIKAALDAGAKRLLIGCGDSGTNDGGAGMAQALGVRLLDAAGNELGWGGGELARLEHIDLTGRDPRLDRVQIDAAVNWHNVLCGPNGVARVFGPQKGASPEIIERLEAALRHYAAIIARDLGIDVRTMPGGGASGGLGAGLHAFLGATLHPYYDIVMSYLEFEDLLREADLVVTAEGGIDSQTPRGKIPTEVARRAKRYQLPVIVLAGTIGTDAHVNLAHGIDAFVSILEAPCTLGEAIQNTARLLTRAAERVMRLILVGQKLNS
jgi:glycerate kinase